MLFHCQKVFPQSFHYGFCNTIAVSKEVNFNTSFNPHMKELTKCEAVSRVQPVGSRSCRAQLWCPAKAKLTMPAPNQPAVPKPSWGNNTAIPTPSPTVTELMASEGNLTAWHSHSAHSLLFLTGHEKTLILLLKTFSRHTVPFASKLALYIQN